MKFSQLEFRQKRLNHRIRAILEAIEPELNSFGRLADLFLTAGAELRESALSAISRAVNEKTLYKMRDMKLQIGEREQELNDLVSEANQIESELEDLRLQRGGVDTTSPEEAKRAILGLEQEILQLQKSLQKAADKQKPKIADQIKSKQLELKQKKLEIKKGTTSTIQGSFISGEAETKAKKEKKAANAVLQNKKRDEIKALRGELKKVSETYFSVTAQNSIFRAAFTRLEKCAEELGYPTAKTGLSTALYGANYKEALSALGKKTAAPQANAKKQYAPSPPPIAPIMAQVAQQAIGKVVGQPAQQNAPAPAPAPTPGAVQTPAKAGPKIKKTGKKNTMVLPNGNQVPLGPVTPAAPTPATAPPAQVTPATQVPATAVQPPTQAAAPARPNREVVQRTIDSLMSLGDKLQDQNAKKYLAALVTWFTNAVKQADLEGGAGTNKNGKGSFWLFSEYVKIVRDQLEMGLVRADANMQNDEYRQEIDPDIFDASVFSASPPVVPFNDKFDASLRTSDKAKFGNFELDGDAIRLRYVFDNNLWPVISSESNRLAAESQTFFRPEDVQQIKKVIQEAQAQNLPLEERLKGVADEKGLDPRQLADLATIVQVSLPDEQEAPEVAPEVTQEVTPTSEPPISMLDVEPFLRKPINSMEDLRPLIKRTIAGVDPKDSDLVTKAMSAFSDVLGKVVKFGRQPSKDAVLGMRSMIDQNISELRAMFTDEASKFVDLGAVSTSPSAPEQSTSPEAQTPLDTVQTPGEPARPFTNSDVAEFLNTREVTQLSDLAPLVSAAVSGIEKTDQDFEKRVDHKLTLAVAKFALSKDPATKEKAMAVRDLINSDRAGFIKMIEDEIANPSQAAATNVDVPGNAPIGPLGMSQIVQRGVESLRAFETADAQSMRALAGQNLKSPDVVRGESAELLQTLKTGGLNAMLSSVPKYLKR